MIKQSGQLDRRITIQKAVVASSNTTEAETAFQSRITDDFGQVDDTCLTSDITSLGGVNADSFGQATRDFETLANVWAKVVEKSGSENEQSDQLVAVKKVHFFIRYRSDINEQMRIVYNSKTYKIEAIISDESRDSFQRIETRLTD